MHTCGSSPWSRVGRARRFCAVNEGKEIVEGVDFVLIEVLPGIRINMVGVATVCAD